MTSISAQGPQPLQPASQIPAMIPSAEPEAPPASAPNPAAFATSAAVPDLAAAAEAEMASLAGGQSDEVLANLSGGLQVPGFAGSAAETLKGAGQALYGFDARMHQTLDPLAQGVTGVIDVVGDAAMGASGLINVAGDVISLIPEVGDGVGIATDAVDMVVTAGVGFTKSMDNRIWNAAMDVPSRVVGTLGDALETAGDLLADPANAVPILIDGMLEHGTRVAHQVEENVQHQLRHGGGFEIAAAIGKAGETLGSIAGLLPGAGDVVQVATDLIGPATVAVKLAAPLVEGAADPLTHLPVTLAEQAESAGSHILEQVFDYKRPE